MYTTVNYGKSLTAAFDAIEDVKKWLGAERFTLLTRELAKYDCQTFANLVSISGITGYPVKAWYELIHGQGTWKDWDDGE